MRVGLGDTLHVMRKAAAGQHHAVAGAYGLVPFGRSSPHPHGTVPLHPYPLRSMAGEDRNPQVQRRLGQPGGQGIAAGDLDATAVQGQFLQVGGQAPGHVEERSQRLGGLEEMLEVGIR